MELLEYEKAIAKYNLSLSIKALPLITWDFYSQDFNSKQALISDVTTLNVLVNKNKWAFNWNFNEELGKDTVIIVTDSELKIVFVSKNMMKMNGYFPSEVIGNTPKMFQGKETSKLVLKEIRQAITNKKSFNKTVLNYCKDGSVYKCHIKGHPVFNQKGELVNFIAFEKIAA